MAEKNGSNSTKVNNEQLLEIADLIYSIDMTTKDRLSWAVNQMREYLKYPLDLYNKDLEKINQQCCSVDKDNNFFIDEKGNILFNKFNQKGIEKRAALLDSLRKKEVDLDIYHCEDLTRVKTLSLYALQKLNGICWVLKKHHRLTASIFRCDKSKNNTHDN